MSSWTPTVARWWDGILSVLVVAVVWPIAAVARTVCPPSRSIDE